MPRSLRFREKIADVQFENFSNGGAIVRRLPSLRGLQAFEAVARTGNLAAAAETLGITPSAVSHRVRGLEEELGVQLLDRQPRGLALTDAGRHYRVPVEAAFRKLEQGTADLLGPDLSRPLTISLTSELGMRWLMPRFARFRAKHPDIDTAILSTYKLADLAAGEADLALRYGSGDWPGLEIETILEFTVSPVCTPALAEQMAGLAPGEALSRQTIITSDYDYWRPWVEAAGLGDFRSRGRLQFGSYSMALAAAADGQGVLLGYSGYVDDDIAAGRLVHPFDLHVAIGAGYYLVYAKERLADPRVRAFRDWVRSELDAPDNPAG